MALPRSCFARSNFKESTIQAFQNPALDLATAILNSMEAAEKVISETLQSPNPTRRSFVNEKDAITDAKVRLLGARQTARHELRKISDNLDLEQRKFYGFMFAHEIIVAGGS